MGILALENRLVKSFPLYLALFELCTLAYIGKSNTIGACSCGITDVRSIFTLKDQYPSTIGARSYGITLNGQYMFVYGFVYLTPYK